MAVIYWPSNYPALETAIRAIPNVATLTNQQICDTLNAQTEVDDSGVDTSSIRRTAIEQRVWGKLESFSNRAFVTTAAQQNLTDACRNFFSLFKEPEGTVVLIRGNALWTAMDADLTLMTASTGGGPVFTTAQANFMRALGDRVRKIWEPAVSPDVVAVHR